MAVMTSEEDKIVVKTSRFNEIVVEPGEVVHVQGGLLGFSGLERFVLINNPEQAPFMWLQCIDDGELAFVVVDPFIFFPGYKIAAKRDDLEPIGISRIDEATILTIVTIPMNPRDITANLRGPLVFNVEKREGKQLVLIDDRYHTKHYLLHDIPEELTGSASVAEAPSGPPS